MGNLLSAHNSNVTLEDLKMGESFNAAQLEAAALLLQSVNAVIFEVSLALPEIDTDIEVEANEPKGENCQLADPGNVWGDFLQADFDALGEMSILAVMNMSMLDPAESADSLILAYGNDEGRIVSLPAAPSAVDAVENVGNDVDVTWVDESTNETGFEIQRKTGAGAFGALATVAADVETYEDETVEPATTYTYRVRANKLGFGNSAWVESPPVVTDP